MKGLLSLEETSKTMPAVGNWLQHADRTAEVLKQKHSHLQGSKLLSAAVEENVLVQIDNLRTHRLIDDYLERGLLNLFGWVYKFETGDVDSYNPKTARFVSLKDEAELQPVYPRPRASK